MTLKNAYLLSAIAIVSFTMLGCSSTGPAYAREDGHSAKDPHSPVTVEPSIQRFIVFDEPTESTDDSGLLRVNVPIRAETRNGQEIDVQYKFTFLDRDGAPLDTQEDFRRMRLPSRDRVYLRGVARDYGGESWRLYIRAAR